MAFRASAKRLWCIIWEPSAARPSPPRSRSIRKASASMREMNWAPARRTEGAWAGSPRLQTRATSSRGQTLISGNLAAAIGGLAPGAPMLGLYALVPEGPHALRIARDRALLVTAAPLGAADGW